MATTVDSMPLARMIERNRPRVEEDQKIQPELADEEEYDWEDEYDWGGRAMSGKIDWRTIVPATHGPTGFDMTTDRARWRVFNSHLHWVNKASTWMFDGDDCFDSTGSLLVTGRDFAEATFPVVIARRLDR